MKYVNDLIPRSALLEAIRGDHPPFYDGQDVANWQEKCINEAPTVDAKPVRHGEWKRDGEVYDDATWVCSVCGEPWSLFYGTPEENGMHYCPNCGAKMDGGKNNGTAK